MLNTISKWPCGASKMEKGREVRLQHFLSCTLFGTQNVTDKQRTVFFTSGQLGIVKLQHVLSRTLFGTQNVRDKQRTVFVTSG